MHRLLHFIRRHTLAVFIVVGIVLLVLAFMAGKWTVYRAHPELSQSDEAQAVLAKVGKLIVLPAGEAPQMATLTDAASAKTGQPFLKDAENGDVIIVYSGAGEAILYRPATGKLVAVGPVTDQSPEDVQAPAPKPAPPPIEASTTDDTSTSSKK